MKVAILVVFMLACASALNLQQEFESWTRQYNKNYSGAERARRFMAFKANTARIALLNAEARKDGANTVFAHNKFSDLTTVEFKRMYLSGYKPVDIKSAEGAKPVVIDVSKAAVDAIPTSFNWVTEGKTTAVKDQEQCGSCWAFSATEGIESAWLMANNSEIVLSPQQIVSCDKVDQGCNGGDLPTAFAYVKKAGLEDNKDYPYTSGNGNTGVCKYNAADVKVHISGFEYAVHNGTKNDTVLAVTSYANGPLSICVDASSWQSYSSGILKRNCGTALDHCVQLTGWGVDSGTEYWIVRNSWNTNWGLSGFIWIERNSGKDLCGITEEATWVTL